MVRAVVHDGVAVDSRQQRLRLLVGNLPTLCKLIEFAASKVAPASLAEETRVAYGKHAVEKIEVVIVGTKPNLRRHGH